MRCGLSRRADGLQHRTRRAEVRAAARAALWELGVHVTTLTFGAGRRADMTRQAIFAGSELPLARNASFQLGAGGVVAGELERNGHVYDLGPGPSGFVGAGYRAFGEQGPWPFLQINATFSVTRATTSTTPYTAFDLRAAAVAGKTIGAGFTPYAVARAFGGPIFWTIDGEDVIGTDLYKYQLGGGLALALAARTLDVFVEGIGIGERGVAAGIGVSLF
jgi:hypothetical protein